MERKREREREERERGREREREREREKGREKGREKEVCARLVAVSQRDAEHQRWKFDAVPPHGQLYIR